MCSPNPIRRCAFSVSQIKKDIATHGPCTCQSKDISEAREKTGRSYAKLQINVYDRE